MRARECVLLPHLATSPGAAASVPGRSSSRRLQRERYNSHDKTREIAHPTFRRVLRVVFRGFLLGLKPAVLSGVSPPIARRPTNNPVRSKKVAPHKGGATRYAQGWSSALSLLGKGRADRLLGAAVLTRQPS